MSHTYEKLSGNKAKLTFTIPAEQFDEAMQQAFLKLQADQRSGFPERQGSEKDDRNALRREHFLRRRL